MLAQEERKWAPGVWGKFSQWRFKLISLKINIQMSLTSHFIQYYKHSLWFFARRILEGAIIRNIYHFSRKRVMNKRWLF